MKMGQYFEKLLNLLMHFNLNQGYADLTWITLQVFFEKSEYGEENFVFSNVKCFW